MSKVNLGGERLGSGNKMQVHLPEFDRTTVDLGYVWRSTMSSGTLVPFMKELALPGDTHEIKLNADVLTHPTIGPLFGSYKVQLDVFSVPIGLYQRETIINKVEMGLDMANVKMPQLRLTHSPRPEKIAHQVNPSALLSYLDIVGLGYNQDEETIQRDFNAVPFLAYWDIFKNYYANKQEDMAYCINTRLDQWIIDQTSYVKFVNKASKQGIPNTQTIDAGTRNYLDVELTIVADAPTPSWSDVDRQEMLQRLKVFVPELNSTEKYSITDLWQYVDVQLVNQGEMLISAQGFKRWTAGTQQRFTITFSIDERDWSTDTEPLLYAFDLKNIDRMREEIIRKSTDGVPFIINKDTTIPPYSLIDKNNGEDILSPRWLSNKEFSQDLLAVKTYQSDLFNNWLNTEWIDGPNGINELTKIDVSDGLKINDFILHKKIFDMLNNIAISGGTYDNWLDATYNQERVKEIKSPMYHGGLIKELTFDEVVSNAETAEQPLGTLAGRGRMTDKHKGGFVKIKTDEPSYIIGIISLTPRVDYSQGNKWDVNLKTWDDFHKPQLDGIGFQDLITDQMSYSETYVGADGIPNFKSAGKQPAWINYQTNVNVCKGNFAIETEQMFMTLNRRYEISGTGQITDLTTYIDPSKFNHIFAYTRRDAQNFWAQIKADITARRKMSAKIIPNL